MIITVVFQSRDNEEKTRGCIITVVDVHPVGIIIGAPGFSPDKTDPNVHPSDLACLPASCRDEVSSV